MAVAGDILRMIVVIELHYSIIFLIVVDKERRRLCLSPRNVCSLMNYFNTTDDHVQIE